MQTILIVEDDLPLRRMIGDALTPHGYKVLEADEGAAALSLIAQQPVHLIIADRAMPGMGGMELLKNLRARQINVPVLIISAYGEEKLWGEAIALGAQDYILKPFKTEDVLKFVKKHLPGGRR